MKRVPIHRGKEIVAHAIVDDEDYERFSRMRWGLIGRGYASSRGQHMARLVHGLKPGDPRAVHHINEDKLDNRRENLKLCTSRGEANREPHPRRRAIGYRRNPRLYSFEELLAMADAA